MPAAAVELRGLTHRYADGTAALQGFDLRIARGECVALIGPNGAGKSTLLQHLNGLLLASSGEVLVEDLRVERGTLAAVRERVGFVFQHAQDQLFMPTVADDVAFGPTNQGLPPPEVQQRVQSALQAVGAAHLALRAPWRLSGGEQRMVAIAGVLAMRPALLVLDEPSAELDAAARERLVTLLRGLPLTRILATHDLELAAQVATRVVVLEAGRIVADGDCREVLAQQPLLQRLGLRSVAA